MFLLLYRSVFKIWTWPKSNLCTKFLCTKWGSSFYIKNKLKSQIFICKKGLSAKMFFSVTTKNLNCEILTKNFVTFKRWDEIKNEKFWYYWVSLKNLIFTGEFARNQYIGRDCLKMVVVGGGGGGGASTVFRFKGGRAKKRRGGIFEGGGLIAKCTLW